MKLQEYISSKSEKRFTIGGIEIVIKNPIQPGDFSPKEVCINSISMIPRHLTTNIKTIFIGEFDFLRDRNMQAMYQDSTIYLTNVYRKGSEMADDIVHEVAHSVEETHYSVIYGDSLLRKEFIQKREKMWEILNFEKLVSKKDYPLFLKHEYDHKFDEFLYKKIGYKNLSVMTNEIFYSPYGATSLREYFANGFEAFFYHKDINKIQQISPILFKKIVTLMNLEK